MADFGSNATTAKTVWATDAPPPARTLDTRRAAVAAAIGIVLFNSAGWYLLSSLTVLAAWIATPLFMLPLAIVLWRHKRIRVLGFLWLLVVVTTAHFVAITTANAIYRYRDQDYCKTLFGAPRYSDPNVQNDCLVREVREGDRRAVPAGAAAGAAGALLSFAGILLLGRRYRTRRALAAMGAATVLLSGIGAVSFAFTYPDQMWCSQWVLQLFLPWQSVFAAALVFLFADGGVMRTRPAPA